ncbi:flagellar basal body rod protein FlgB [Siccirubricoccus deserti]|nr:flagellar basal body protein [Siccirubricoccus deserti]GGC61638.1 flagellar basal body rod protein FlgB [Siccirubricoccus deserti]
MLATAPALPPMAAARLNVPFAELRHIGRMDPSRTSTIALAERRLAWLDTRQAVLAQNIANADTPGYRPRDITPFAALLARGGGVALARTDGQHIAQRRGEPLARPDRGAVERAPNGNAVSLDREAMRVADTDTAHALATGLHRRWLGMFRTALGRQQ